jgi:MerR family copper efflux transcriptional regulator
VPTDRTRPMTVGELSRRTGVSAKALREYTDIGLVHSLGRSSFNYRLYTADALRYQLLSYEAAHPVFPHDSTSDQ